MGIHIDTLDFFWETIGKDTSLQKKWLLELGNQEMRSDVKKKYGFDSTYSKIYFLNLKCNHHAIDFNGLDGAIPLDMTHPISIKRFINTFEIVTDFGCMEHICWDLANNIKTKPYYPRQWQAWKNIHDMGKVGCIYIHTLPLVGSVPGHGGYHYTLKFFENLCEANNYKPLLSRICQHDLRHHKRDYVFSSYVKENENPFTEVEVFKEWLHSEV